MAKSSSRVQLERRANILMRTREIVAKSDSEKINMGALAKACGISIPTLYNQFKDKDALLAATMDEVLRLYFQQFDPGDQPGLDQMLSLADGTANVMAENKELCRWMYQLNPAIRRQSSLLMARELYRSFLNKMRADGDIDNTIPLPLLSDRLYQRLRSTAIEWLHEELSLHHFKRLRRCEIALILLSSASKSLRPRLLGLVKEASQPPD